MFAIPTTMYTIIGSPISLFTRKLEAAMQLYGAPFTIERSPPRNELEPTSPQARAATHQIPVLVTPENWALSDTTPIMAMLDARFPARRLFPAGAHGVLVHIIEEVLDEWVARVMVHFRWHYDDNTQFIASLISSKELSVEQSKQFPLAQWGLRACRATGTESETQQRAAEREYFGILDALEAQLERTEFAVGDCPSAVDAILLGGVRGHTNHDPLPDLSAYKNVAALDKRVANFSGPTGGWSDFPGTTPFAEHMLRIASESYRPYILGNKQALAKKEKAFVVEIYGENVSYLCRPYPERSRQMIVDRIKYQLDDEERYSVAQWLSDHGLADCFTD